MSYRRLEDPEEYPLHQIRPAHPQTFSGAPVYPVNSSEREPVRTAGDDMPFPGKRFGRAYRTRVFLSYAPDWVLCIGLSAAFFALDKVPGFKREFSLTDTSQTVSVRFAVHERVPDWLLYVIFAAAPLTLMPIINLILLRSLWDWHSSWLGWLLSCSITGAITQFSKITVGRPRPDLIDRCQPISGAVDPPLGLSTVAICTQTDVGILRDGWRSFPSGHSSLSFAGLGFLSFYLAGKLHLFDERGHTVKAWISLVPLSGAALVAISRTMDYRHHWQDVLTGSTLGIVVAYFGYRQYYPPLSSQICHLPYPPRVHRGGQALPTHHSRPSEAQALSSGPPDSLSMRPRMPEPRYSDRHSIGDEEMGRPSVTRDTDPSKDDLRHP
ncbi:acid phosphatase/Vanadium-dependent haloperoxidase [Dichomitus squalens]|uniref:Acid phosphatase/Vanadium-dependent haloperoxidase n=1 Tax=Dichomitus squalens TaxID=114155 RepID=A0A4Q9QEI2_9APHY|nr:acid phosphatase/Vanadium-dependent haloperoxidase [Dichomitus squalens]